MFSTLPFLRLLNQRQPIDFRVSCDTNNVDTLTLYYNINDASDKKRFELISLNTEHCDQPRILVLDGQKMEWVSERTQKKFTYILGKEIV